MTRDPIVSEVRKAGAELAGEAGNDTHRFFENLRATQKKYKSRLVGKEVIRAGYKTPPEK